MSLMIEGPEIDDPQIAVLSAHETFANEVARILQRAADAGFVSGKRDDKADKNFMDEQWGEG